MKGKIVSIVAAAGLLFGSATVAAAKSGKASASPGHMMQRYGSVPGHPGASGYAPGHLKHGKFAKLKHKKMGKHHLGRSRSTMGSRY